VIEDGEFEGELEEVRNHAWKKRGEGGGRGYVGYIGRRPTQKTRDEEGKGKRYEYRLLSKMASWRGSWSRSEITPGRRGGVGWGGGRASRPGGNEG
jgi:hypothetical protein